MADCNRTHFNLTCPPTSKNFLSICFCFVMLGRQFLFEGRLNSKPEE